jgi:hypothetical protein
MDSLQSIALMLALSGINLLFPGCSNHPPKPSAVHFHTETLNRVDDPGDNWCITWTQMEITLELE